MDAVESRLVPAVHHKRVDVIPMNADGRNLLEGNVTVRELDILTLPVMVRRVVASPANLLIIESHRLTATGLKRRLEGVQIVWPLVCRKRLTVVGAFARTCVTRTKWNLVTVADVMVADEVVVKVLRE